MPSRLACVIILLSIWVSLPFEGRAADSVDGFLQTLVKQGKGTEAGRKAWDRLVAAGPSALPALKGMDGAETVTANWLRTAFDRIVEESFRADKGLRIDGDALLAFAKDSRHVGRARRLALEVVDRLRPGTSVKLFPAWLDDPEFRYEAVEVALKEADALVKDQKKDQAAEVYRKAFAAVRDLQQTKKVAVGLLNVGVKVSVADHLGFLMDWYVIGPFDAMDMKGFKTAYSPERGIDLKVELAGKGKKVGWKRFRVAEPAPSVSGPHVALVNLRVPLGDADDAVAYAYTEIEVARAQEVEFRGSADDNFTVWVNGRREFGFEEYRNGVRLDRHRFPVKLKAGKNTVLVKICQFPANSEPNWEFLLRIVDKTSKGIGFKNALSENTNEK